LTPSVAAAASSGAARPPVRWAVPAALLVAEYVALSVLVDLPTAGPARQLASSARTAVPVAIGALAAGWLVARRGARSAFADAAGILPAWRPWPALLAHLVAFGATASLAHRLLAPHAPPASIAALAGLAALAAAAAILAISTAAPIGWLVRVASANLRTPVLAVATGMLAWRAVAAAEELWGGLRGATLGAVAVLLRLARPDVLSLPDESVIGAGGFEVVIAPVCSGVDGLGLVLVFQAAWLSLARDRIRVGRGLVLLLVGAGAALAANVVRIAALILLGASGREELALGAFHSKAGWILFVAVALATVAAAERLPWFRRADATAAEGADGVPPRAGAYVGPLVAGLATALVTSAWASPGHDLWYGARVLAAALALVAVRRDLPRPAPSFSWVAVALGAGVCAAAIAFSSAPAAADALAQVERLGAAERIAWIAMRVAGACLVLPVVEEVAFRGFLLPWLLAPDFESVPPRAWTWPALLLSSLASGALHPQWMVGAAAGLAFAAAKLRRGRLADAILAHAVANAGIALAVLLGGRWDLWS
jgi:exosortase E/protease (VPEID-CTERM system)